MKILLASTSAIRRQLLINAGIEHEAIGSGVNEEELKLTNPGLPPDLLAQHLANAKCLSVSNQFPEHIVIGADQVLSLEGKVFSKPRDIKEARAHLTKLRGRTHSLTSALSCAHADAIIWNFSDHAELTMRYHSEQFLDNYLAMEGEDARTSVGGYKLEGIGIQLFEKIEGNYFTILGLPLLPLLNFLRSIGAIVK